MEDDTFIFLFLSYEKMNSEQKSYYNSFLGSLTQYVIVGDEVEVFERGYDFMRTYRYPRTLKYQFSKDCIEKFKENHRAGKSNSEVQDDIKFCFRSATTKY